MENYRSLTEEEIIQLQQQDCTAEDWTAISVDEDFSPNHISHVDFYGDISLGSFNKPIEVEEGFFIPSGIRRAVLCNVSVGDNTLIEGVGTYIANYDIGEECYLANIGHMTTTPDATFGEGHVISVLSEGGEGNVMIFSALTAQLAAFMVRHANDGEVWKIFKKLVRHYTDCIKPTRGNIGYGVKIVNTNEITNALIGDECEISGAARLCECTIQSTPEASCYVGHNVLLDNSIVQAGTSLLDGAKIDNTFIGEACHIGKGASVESSLFFANSYLDNGESCAAFCGPFTVSHHKSTLLIGGMYSFYNAGSGTNYSNHAYKMGPLHWGTMNRGCKTASGCHLLWPATIGAFSMCMGKIATHPQVANFPFSYLFGSGDSTTYLVPGRNLTTVGTWRDISKWPKRDRRPHIGRQSMVCFDWLNPMVATACLHGKQLLEQLRKEQGEGVAAYLYNGVTIRNASLQHGLRLYDMALHLYMGKAIEQHSLQLPKTSIGTGQWLDLGGLLMPETEDELLIEDMRNGHINDLQDVTDRFVTIFRNYTEYKWAAAYRLILDYYQLETLTNEDAEVILQDYKKAHTEWLEAIKYDAEKEFRMGDIEPTTLDIFLKSLPE